MKLCTFLGNITRNQEKTEESNGDTFSKSNFVDKASFGLLHYVPYWKTIKKNEFSRLFECCLLVGLTLESQKNVPYIKNIFPPNVCVSSFLIIIFFVFFFFFLIIIQ